MNNSNKYILLALLAAFLYSISVPVSKYLLMVLPKTMLVGILYIGAGFGILIIYIFKKMLKRPVVYQNLEKSDLPYVILMVILDIIAPILLIWGLSSANSETISLINNFEIIATALIAAIIFKEKIYKNTWIGIILVTLAVIILSIDFETGFSLSYGSILAILATICWGFENNCTKKISSKNPFQIVIIKGLFSGTGSIIIGILLKETITNYQYIIYALLLGFVSYGLSIFVYILAQKYLGAAKTSCYYALTPFIGVLFSFIIFKDKPHISFYIALAVMFIGSVFVTVDKVYNKKYMLLYIIY